MIKNQYQYFIEDVDTGLWYYNVLKMPQGNTVHTEIYYPKEAYWTNNPLDALMYDDKQLMEDVLKNMFKSGNLNIMTEVYGVYKNLKVTEHEFVYPNTL